MKLAYVVDFDGTITRRDITSSLARQYAGPAMQEINRRYRDGEMGTRVWLQEIVRYFPADREELCALADKTAELKPGFDLFLETAHSSGEPVFIASDGFSFYMEPILERQGLLRYIDAIYGNRLIIGEEGSVSMELPYANPTCDVCGNCKASHVVALKDQGYKVVFIGNGFNDRYGASHADLIFARAGDPLAGFCTAQRIPFVPFNDFHDIVGFTLPGDRGCPVTLCNP